MGYGTGGVKAEREPPRNPGEALLAAQDEAFRKRSAGAYLKMTDLYPREPALYANVLRYSARWGPIRGIARPELRPNTRSPSKPGVKSSQPIWKPLPDSPEVRNLERAIETGKELEPDNCYFSLFEAALRFDQGRDSEALAAIDRAADKKRLDSHWRDEQLARMTRRRGTTPVPIYWLNPYRKATAACAAIFPDYFLFRQAARLAAWHAEQRARRGEYDQALAIMADLVQIGGVMRDHGDSLDCAIIGTSVQKVGIEYVHRSFPDLAASRRKSGSEREVVHDPSTTGQLARIQSVAPQNLRPDQWHVLRHELLRSERFLKRLKTYTHNLPSAKSSLTAQVLLVTAGSILVQLLVLGVLWLSAGLLLRRRQRESVETLGPSRLNVWLLAVLPPALGFAFVALVTWSLSPRADWYCRVPPLAWAVSILVVVIAAARTRIAAEVPRLDTFAARLRTASEFAIQALVVLYLAATILWLPITAQANKDVDRMIENEVQLVWECPPSDLKQDRR